MCSNEAGRLFYHNMKRIKTVRKICKTEYSWHFKPPETSYLKSVGVLLKPAVNYEHNPMV